MGENRRLGIERVIDRKLEGRVAVMVGAANDMGDVHVEIVDDDGERVEWRAVAAADDAVANLASVLSAWPKDEVVPPESFAWIVTIDAESDGMRATVSSEVQTSTAAVVVAFAASCDVSVSPGLEVVFGTDASICRL